MAHHHCNCCEHEHHHEHHHEHEEHDLKSQLWLIAITVVLLIAAVLIEKNLNLATWQLLLVYLVPYLLIGHETLHEAWEGITSGDAFNEHFLTLRGLRRRQEPQQHRPFDEHPSRCGSCRGAW